MCRVENRTGTVKLKYRQVGLDESAWQTLRPHATASFAWENLLSEKLLEVIQDGRDPSTSTKIDISVIGDHPVVPADESGSSTVCVRVLIMHQPSPSFCTRNDMLKDRYQCTH